MKVKIIDHGCKHWPRRAHANDVGADVFAMRDQIVEVGCSAAVPLGFGLDLPAGFGAFIFPRSSQAKAGINCALSPLDPGYTGQMHALIQNTGHEAYHIYEGDRIGQLVVLPVLLPDFLSEDMFGDERGDGAFGSTGK